MTCCSKVLSYQEGWKQNIQQIVQFLPWLNTIISKSSSLEYSSLARSPADAYGGYLSQGWWSCISFCNSGSVLANFAMGKIGPPHFYSPQSECFCSMDAIFPLIYYIPHHDIPNSQVRPNLTKIYGDCSPLCAMTRFHSPSVKGWGKLGASRVLFGPWRWEFFGCS